MLGAMTDPGCVNIRANGSIEVFGGPGSTDKKLNLFLRGRRAGGKRWVSEKLPSGKTARYEVAARDQPERDTFGIHEADVDDSAEDLHMTVANALGFRER